MTSAARGRAWVLTTLAALGGCLQPPAATPDHVECTAAADCRTAAGEVCDEGVCWGDPPEVDLAAVLGPAAIYTGEAATTEVAALEFAAGGWFGAAGADGLTLGRAVRVTGQVKAPCPAALEGCSGTLVVPGQIRWSRPSTIPGLPDVTVSTGLSASIAGGNTATGFELYLPRPAERTVYTVTFTPSTTPLGPGLPSPANLLPPHRIEIAIDPSDTSVVRDLMMPDAAARTLTGRIVQVGAPSLAGWRVRAEVGDGSVQGTFTLASSIATTSTTGDFTLALVDDETLGVVDVILEPPTIIGADGAPPRVRKRDHVVTSPLGTLTLPAFDRLIAVPVEVGGSDGSGTSNRVSGATVVARLDQAVGNVFLQHEATTTTADGVGSLQLLLGEVALPWHYELDVLPGPTSQLAAVYGVDLDVADVVPAPPPVVLPRGQALVGTVLDENGFGVPGAQVTAAISAASLCELSSEDLRVARGLAPVQAATDANGEFALFLDPDFDGAPLYYDLAVEPAAGTWAPRWTFPAQPLNAEHRTLWLPAAAHVRARIFDPSANPAPDTAVTVYELTDQPAPCPQAAYAETGLAVRRAVGTSDGDGIVHLILPRVE